MSDPRRPEIADPEFEPFLPTSRVRLRDFEPRDYQRVVVNPFLAVLGLIVVVRAGAWLFESSLPPLALLMILPFLLLPQLIHYHCLDCGQTGRYLRRQTHACPSVVARWNKSRSPLFPSGRGQLTIWSWLLAAIAFLWLVAW